ncbi:hypothetical protein NFI96_007381 [Prochilodus magdalenae]|nr:hypothetical protein NFI96_007381 [Prochilodus magdalenae]
MRRGFCLDCFVHLSFQEFLAALYVFHCYVSKNMEDLQCLETQNTEWSHRVSLKELLRGAVCKALESENGHLDLFLRFLLGISLESNQQLLKDLLTQTVRSSESIKKTVKYIKDVIQSEDLASDRSINLFLCLTEMNDQSLSSSIQEYLKSEKSSEKKLSPAECLALAYMLVTSEEVLDELNLKNYRTAERGYLRLIPAVSNCRKAILAGYELTMDCSETLCAALKSTNSHLKELDLSYTGLQNSELNLLSAALRSSNCKLEILRLAGCKLTMNSCATLCAALKSTNSPLKELDLSNSDLQDSGVDLLSAGLKSLNCKLEILRLSGCMVTEEGCSYLALALSENPSYMKELDLSYNHPGDTGVKLLSARLEDPQCRLDTLRVDHAGEIRMKPGLKKYSCELTLDPNTVSRYLSLCEENRKVVWVREKQSYPDHPERFDDWEQVLSRESLTGRCYWEAEWSGEVEIAVSYKGIVRKGERRSGFLANELISIFVAIL